MVLRAFFPQCNGNMTTKDCPVCLENLNLSTEACQIPKCEHFLHAKCFNDLIEHGNFYCPLCYKSLVDLSSMWAVMKCQVEKFPLQGKMAGIFVDILCRDCDMPGKSKFHVIGLECGHCLGFNTVQKGEKFYTLSDNECEYFLDFGVIDNIF